MSHLNVIGTFNLAWLYCCNDVVSTGKLNLTVKSAKSPNFMLVALYGMQYEHAPTKFPEQECHNYAVMLLRLVKAVS